MKKVKNIALIVFVPLFSAVAVCGFIFMFAFDLVCKIESLAFLSVGRSSVYQVLITIGLLWASFYLFIVAVFPREKYRLALTRLSKRRICTAVIGLVGPLSYYAFFKVDGLIGLFVKTFAVMAVPFCLLAIIPALLIEPFCYAYVITDTAKVKYWKSLVISAFYLFVLPLIIVFGVERTMAIKPQTVDCAFCGCKLRQESGHLKKGEDRQVIAIEATR